MTKTIVSPMGDTVREVVLYYITNGSTLPHKEEEEERRRNNPENSGFCKFAEKGQFSPNYNPQFPGREYCEGCGFCYCCNDHAECMEEVIEA